MTARPSLHAYYFGAHAYTLVPENIDRDMAWMADHGTQSVSLGVIESFARGGKRNIEHVARAAEKYQMTLDLVPSFVCGLVAGAPHVPCRQLCFRPDLWARDEHGDVRTRGGGPLGSIYHPEVLTIFRDTIVGMVEDLPFSRLIWDEPKCFVPEWYPDGCDAARTANPSFDWERHVDTGVEFFSQVNDALKDAAPELEIWLFDEAFKDDLTVERLATIRHLDAYGLDGRPWRTEDSRLNGKRGRKSLISEGQRFIDAAHQHKRRSFALIENHKLDRVDIPIMDRGLPEVTAMDYDHLLYYYYPNACEDPAASMAVISKHLRTLRNTHA